jgi:hypothetical protein
MRPTSAEMGRWPKRLAIAEAAFSLARPWLNFSWLMSAAIS